MTWDWEQKAGGYGFTGSDVQKSGTGMHGYFADQPEHTKIYLGNLQKTLRTYEEIAASNRATHSQPRVYPSRYTPEVVHKRPREKSKPVSWMGLLLLVVALPLITALTTPLGPFSIRALAHALAGNNSISENFNEQYYFDEDISQLATIPSSRLFDSHLSGAAPDWAGLTNVQQESVRAAWLRYIRNPTAFNSMEARHQSFYLAAFDGYLLNEGSTCERPLALEDRGKIYLTGLAGMRDHEKAGRLWNEGATLCPTDSTLASLGGMTSHRFSGILEQLAVQLEALQISSARRFAVFVRDF